MSRLVYPEQFLQQVDLFNDIKTKHDLDGASSPLNPYLTQQGIDLGIDLTAVNSAVAKNKLFMQAEKDAEDFTQDRNTLFDPVFENMTDGFQYLKRLYRGNPAELGHWGATVNGNAIVYPPEFVKRVELFGLYKEKHDSYAPAPSPLDPFLTENNINLDDDETATGEALDKHKDAKQTEKNAENYREKRDILFDPIMEHVRGMGQFLKGLYVKHPKHLGNWGYVVDESPRDPKFRETTIPPGTAKTIRGIKLNTQAENTGQVGLLLHKGKEVGPQPKSLAPEMRFTILRGWGTITVESQDPTTEGKIGYITTNIGAG